MAQLCFLARPMGLRPGITDKNGSACSKQHGCMKFKDGFFPRSNGFYRKHFKLPASWAAEAAVEKQAALASA